MSLLRRLIYIWLVFLSTLLAGAFGYSAIEDWPFVDALYMSIITVTTVGFSEVHPLSDQGRMFTTLLILLGVACFTFSFGVITNYVIAGELRGLLGERKMRRLISSIRNHVIICGYGRMGHEMCLELQREGKSFIVVDENEDSVRQAQDDGYTAFRGDPGLDETLTECGIERASGLAAVADSDAKNLMVVISARGLNSALPIVARASAEDAPEKFMRAGADSIYLPYRTAGRRLVQMMIRPEVVGFFEDIMHDESALGVTFESLAVSAGSELDGKTLKEAAIRARTGVHIVGVKRVESGLEPDLTPSTVLQAGDTIFVMGQSDQLDELSELLTKSE
jgi:voltage-gated potassium channel